MNLYQSYVKEFHINCEQKVNVKHTLKYLIDNSKLFTCVPVLNPLTPYLTHPNNTDHISSRCFTKFHKYLNNNATYVTLTKLCQITSVPEVMSNPYG